VAAPVKVVWSREEDIQHDLYRPYYVGQLTAGLDAMGQPVCLQHRVVGASILARWLPPAFANGVDGDIIDGALGPYQFANSGVDYVRHEGPAALQPGFWRGVGMTRNTFMVESFIDELAHLSGADPLDYRLGLLTGAPRAAAVLRLAADKSGWATPLTPGKGRGLSVLFGFGTYLAQVAEVEVDAGGGIRVTRVTCAVDCGTIVNPDTVKAQVEGGTIFGLSAALYGEITFREGRVEQGNFDSYPVMRIDEAPQIDVHLITSSEKPGGVGEPGTAGISPAVANAVFAATGTRKRILPLNRQS
jgi:isoquinoline 1-oxidoreductase subunit beta